MEASLDDAAAGAHNAVAARAHKDEAISAVALLRLGVAVGVHGEVAIQVVRC